MVDRVGTEIESDSEKAKVKMTNSAGDEIVECHSLGSYPPILTKEKRAVRNCAELLY